MGGSDEIAFMVVVKVGWKLNVKNFVTYSKTSKMLIIIVNCSNMPTCKSAYT